MLLLCARRDIDRALPCPACYEFFCRFLRTSYKYGPLQASSKLAGSTAVVALCIGRKNVVVKESESRGHTLSKVTFTRALQVLPLYHPCYTAVILPCIMKLHGTGCSAVYYVVARRECRAMLRGTYDVPNAKPIAPLLIVLLNEDYARRQAGEDEPR